LEVVSNESPVCSPLRVARCWDLAAVHRLLFGGRRADPQLVWATLADLAVSAIPVAGQLDLAGDRGDGGAFKNPPRPRDHLRPQ
jgi:DNA polymerase-1